MNKMRKDFPRITNDRLNHLIAHLLEKGFIEKVGYGKWRLVPVREEERPKAAEPKPPAPAPPAASEPTRQRTDAVTADLVEEYIKEKPAVTASDVAKFFEIPDNRASAFLSTLFKDGKVRRSQEANSIGAGRLYRYYPATDTRGEANPTPGVQIRSAAPKKPKQPRKRSEERIDAVYDYIDQHPGVTFEDIAKGLNLSTGYVPSLVRRLKEDGDIRYEGGYGKGGPARCYVVEDEPDDASDENTAQAQTPPQSQPSLADRLVGFVREHPFATAMSVARNFTMSEERAANYLNATYMNGRIKRIRLDQGGGKWIWQYVVPEHPAARTASGAPPPTPPTTVVRPPNPLPSTPFPERKPENAALGGPATPAPAPPPKAKKGNILGAITYTIEVKLDPTDIEQVNALKALETACECRTLNVSV